MRALLRPRLARYRQHAHPVSAGGPLTVTWAGVSTLLVDDGRSALLTDGFFSRPSLLRVATRRVQPDEARITDALSIMGVERLEALVPVHTHYDHVLDSAAVARRTGATIIGGSSAAQVARGSGLPEDQVMTTTSGSAVTRGSYRITLVESAHSPPDRYPGTIDAPVTPPARAGAYRCGEAWAMHVEHTSGRRLLVQGSAGFVTHSLDHLDAEVVLLGVGQLGVLPEEYVRDYWQHTVRAVGGRHVVLVHWDDFFRGLDRPLKALPRPVDDLDRTWSLLTELAAADGVRMHLPPLLRPIDPWDRT